MSEKVSGWILEGLKGTSEWILEGLKGVIIGFVKWVVTGIISNSYWICLIAALLALILYISGMKKAGKYVSISFILYFLLQAMGAAL